MLRQLLTIFILIFATNLYHGQSDISIGQWKSHLSQQSGKLVTQSDSEVYYATEQSLIIIDKTDLSFRLLSTVEGLNDVGISNIEYDSFNDQLIIAYNNTNIDIIRNDLVINIPDVKNNNNIVGDKTITAIHVENESSAFLATSFGVVEFNPNDFEFGSTIITDLRVNDLVTNDNKIFAATEDGIYMVDKEVSINIADFSQWSLLGSSNGLPTIYSCDELGVAHNAVYALVDDLLFKSDNDFFSSIYTFQNAEEGVFLSNDDLSNLLLGIRVSTFNSKVLILDASDSITEGSASCTNILLDVVMDQDNQLWYGDDFNDLRRSINDDCLRIKIPSPLSNDATDIAILDNVAYVASGGVTDAFGPLASRQGFYFLEEGSWNNRNQDNVDIIRDSSVLNIFRTISHPRQNKVYFGSFFAGLLEYDIDEDQYSLYNKNNSSLQGTVNDEASTRISGFAFDQEENLWMSNYGAPRPLNVMTSDGEWFSFAINANTQIADMVVDNNGFIWMLVTGNSGGVLVYDTKGTIDDDSDDEQRFFGAGSTLTTTLVRSIALDNNNDVWVGTAEGPVIFDCGASSLDASLGCNGTKIKVLQDSIAAFLLETEDILAIEVDGANRKWLGTTTGIYVQSADGEEQVFRFTVDNSPLISNTINALTFNDSTGEVFIATGAGIQSYRSDATSARPVHSNNVYAFPNPVRPDYSGPIAIKGLAQDARVKITDVNGKLVRETTAIGGQAIWDGSDYTGQQAKTGVYLVFSSSVDNFSTSDSFVTKIMIIR